jgi:hypothetical protein
MISANTRVFSSDVLYGPASKQQKLTPYCHPAPKKGDTQEKSQEEKSVDSMVGVTRFALFLRSISYAP